MEKVITWAGLDVHAERIVIATLLQDHGRAVIVGQRTFGKGTVQELLELGDRYETTFVCMGLGMVGCLAGDYTLAEGYSLQGLELSRQYGSTREGSCCLGMLGCVDLKGGAHEQALSRLQQGVELLRETSFLEEVGWFLGLQAIALCTAGQLPRARQALVEALQIGTAHQVAMPTYHGLAAAALYCATLGQVERALELLAQLDKLPFVSKRAWIQAFVSRSVNAAAASLPEAVVEAARRRGQEREGDGIEA